MQPQYRLNYSSYPLTLPDFRIRGLLGSRISQLRFPVTASNSSLVGDFTREEWPNLLLDRAKSEEAACKLLGLSPDSLHILLVPNKARRRKSSIIYPLSTVYPKPYPGDRFWIREFWRESEYDYDSYVYRADSPYDTEGRSLSFNKKYNSPITMPRSISRITLEVRKIHTERLQDISDDSCRAEGIIEFMSVIGGYGLPEWNYTLARENQTPQIAYEYAWDNFIIGKKNKKLYFWDSNPLVWVYEVNAFLNLNTPVFIKNKV